MFGGYCGGIGVAGWALMIGFWTAIVAVVVWATPRLFPAGGRRDDGAARVLDHRLAVGDIDPSTYRQMRDRLAQGITDDAVTSGSRWAR